MTPRSVLLTVTTILLSATAASARADMCRLPDGREFATDYMGNIVSPIELVGFRLRERDDLRGFEIFRPYSPTREVYLVDSCIPSFGGGEGPESVAFSNPYGKTHGRENNERGGRGNQGERDGGRDSGGKCERQSDDDQCAEG